MYEFEAYYWMPPAMVYSSILRGDTNDTQLCLSDIPIILQIVHHAASTIAMQLNYNHHQGKYSCHTCAAGPKFC